MRWWRKLLLVDDHVCPWWLAYTFDNPVRRLLHDPGKITGRYLGEGMTALDIGCGMGYFSLGMARLVGSEGRVIAVDLQQKMLDRLRRRADRRGVGNRIESRTCEHNDLGVVERVDFILTFWMVHEVPRTRRLFEQIHSILKADGKWLLAEPKIHTTQGHFDGMVSMAEEAGFRVTGRPTIRISYAAVLEKTA